MFLDRLICLKYHAVNQSNKVVDARICQTGLSSLPSSGCTSWQKYNERECQRPSNLKHPAARGCAGEEGSTVQGPFWK